MARISEKLVFNRLSFTVQREICEQMVEQERQRLQAIGFEVVIDAATIELLVREGYHRTLGARPMRNVVESFLQEHLTQKTMSDW